MLTVGIDSIEIERIKKAINRKRFVERVYGENELAELEERGFPPQTAAACFALKEAFGKAIGRGIRGFKLCEVELLHDASGRPLVHLSGSAKRIAEGMGLSFEASITHTKEIATAVIIAYRKGESL